MATFDNLTTTQLKQAVQIREQIESLQEKLDALLGGTEPTVKGKRKMTRPKGKHTMSPEARARIGAAQKLRWAKAKGASAKSATKLKPAVTPKKKGGMTPEGKAKIAAAMKARWQAKKKGSAAPNRCREVACAGVKLYTSKEGALCLAENQPSRAASLVDGPPKRSAAQRIVRLSPCWYDRHQGRWPFAWSDRRR